MEHASNRDSEEPSKQSEAFCAGEEREQSHNGMNSNCFTENARPWYLPQDNRVEERHKYCASPAFCVRHRKPGRLCDPIDLSEENSDIVGDTGHSWGHPGDIIGHIILTPGCYRA